MQCFEKQQTGFADLPPELWFLEQQLDKILEDMASQASQSLDQGFLAAYYWLPGLLFTEYESMCAT